MKIVDWDREKNRLLREERGVCFEDVVIRLAQAAVLDTVDHPNQEKYPGQKIHLLDIKGYVYLVPFVETESGIFLKTVIPSRKATRDYLGR
ncbi:BrnT family toxin [Pseudohaliea rubra]|uniref:Toxin n=1 Tax=Pseudohaliea rubra DSM 19751 TaxID=1265313 RepID=A0A095VRV0_9GAMM|nr:BrnT family toxin [Pseudohaliea rubra]KGE03828.1 hypothetical protein HRUBRA_01575 [Pseudohaliea rubra DSM 19751]